MIIIRTERSSRSAQAGGSIMEEVTVPDAARRRAAFIEILQRLHLGSAAASILVVVDGWWAGRWSVGLLAAIDGAPIKMLRSKSTESGGRGWDVARL